jgi:hypothetical protein
MRSGGPGDQRVKLRPTKQQDVVMGDLSLIAIVIFSFFIVCAPFFLYGINMRTRQTAKALEETNKLLAEIRDKIAP